MSLILILIALGIIYRSFLYPIQKLWQIKREGIVLIDCNRDVRFNDLDLKFGIFHKVLWTSLKSSVTWTGLNPTVICITYNLYESGFYSRDIHFDIKNICVPVLSKLSLKNKVILKGYKEIVPLVKEYFHLEEEIDKLRSQSVKIHRLNRLIANSLDSYNNQQDIYQKSLSQINSLISKGEELKTFYHEYIRKILTSSEIAAGEIDVFLNNDLKLNMQVLDIQLQSIKEQYQYLKDRETAYHNLVRDITAKY